MKRRVTNSDDVRSPLRLTSDMRQTAQPTNSFDDLVGAGEQRPRQRKTDDLRRLRFGDEVVLRGHVNRQLGCFFAFENAIDILGRAPKLIYSIGSIERKAAVVDVGWVPIHGRQFMLASKRRDPSALRQKVLSVQWSTLQDTRRISAHTVLGLIRHGRR